MVGALTGSPMSLAPGPSGHLCSRHPRDLPCVQGRVRAVSPGLTPVALWPLPRGSVLPHYGLPRCPRLPQSQRPCWELVVLCGVVPLAPWAPLGLCQWPPGSGWVAFTCAWACVWTGAPGASWEAPSRGGEGAPGGQDGGCAVAPHSPTLWFWPAPSSTSPLQNCTGI